MESDYTYLSGKAVLISLNCSMPNASLSVLLYLLSLADSLLLAKAIVFGILLSGVLFLGQLEPSLVCSKVAPKSYSG